MRHLEEDLLELKRRKKRKEEKKNTSNSLKPFGFFVSPEVVSFMKKHSQALSVAIATVLGGSLLIGQISSSISSQVSKETCSLTDFQGEETEKEVEVFSVQNNTLSRELQKALEEKEPLLLKVEPTGDTYGEIYKTIDFVKEVVSQYSVFYPILYDIEPLMKASTLEKNCLLAEVFCNKLGANGCYTGLYGSDRSMQTFTSKFIEVTNTHSIDFYDKCVVYQGKTPSYQGIYHMWQKENGFITFQYDLKRVIAENGLNQKENFIEDKKYVIKENDTLEKIASLFGMKVEDLAFYNQIENKDRILIGQELIIPNVYQSDQKEHGEHQNLHRFVKGIDVSSHQGEIAWEKVKENVDYAIVRLCDFYFKKEDGTCALDNQFINNMLACEQLNIPVGVYYYSRATTEEEAKIEAKFVASCLKEYSLEYPVYMDIETEYQNQLIREDPNTMKKIVISAMTELEGEGYYAGVYCNRGSDQDTNRRSWIQDLSKQYTFWLTSNSTYHVSVDFDTFNEINYELLLIPDSQIGMYQYTERGRIEGIDDQNVDINYANFNLTKTIVEKGFHKIKQ